MGLASSRRDYGNTTFVTTVPSPVYVGGTSVNVQATSTSSSMVNGRSVVTKRFMNNGLETVIIEEDGMVTSHLVNGQNMMDQKVMMSK